MDKVPAADQICSLVAALAHVRDWSVAIDGGANLGDWSRVMTEHFETVHAFEPVAGLCDPGSAVLHLAALMDAPGTVTMTMPRKRTSHRSRYAVKDGDVPAVTIDGLELRSCGLIKLDLEGAELLALRGAQATIEKFHPVIIVELDDYGVRYGYAESDLRAWLTQRGYEQVFESRPDAVFA